MTKPTGCYIAQVICVAKHVPDRKVRFRTADVEDAFKSIVNAQPTFTNVDDNLPANVPRFLIAQGHKQILITQESVQLTLNFGTTDEGLQQTFEVVARNLAKFWVGVQKFVAASNMRDTGALLTINYPSKAPREQLAQYLSTRFYHGKSYGTVATFDLKLGFNFEGRLFKNFGVNIYEMREGLIVGNALNPQPAMLDVSKFKITEQGYALFVDVNNRPSFEGNTQQDESNSFNTIVDELRKMTLTEAGSILGF